MRAVFAIAIKDIRLLLRDPMAVFWTLCFPLIYATFFGVISSGGSGARGAISLAVVDRDARRRAASSSSESKRLKA